MKQRFSYLDLRLITNEVAKELDNCYLQNVYSLESSNRHFMIKFDAGAGQTGKRFLLVDPGMRYHLTKFQHEQTHMPSFFVQKLRKYLKNQRATRFWTAPASRLMVITFQEGKYYLVFEFFSGGNLILLDSTYKILTLFRTVRGVGPNSANYQLGGQYPHEINVTSSEENLQPMPTRKDIRQWVSKDKLGKALYSKVSDPSSSLLEYCLLAKGLDPKAKFASEEDIDSKLDLIYEAIEMALKRTRELVEHTPPVKGYILFDNKDNSTEFEPFSEYFDTVWSESKVEVYPTYNTAVDNYFGDILSDKVVNRVEQLYAQAKSRLEAARNERKNRIQGLEDEQQRSQDMGVALQENAELVDAAINAVQALVDQGADWGDAKNLIQLEKEKGNPVAKTIKSLELNKMQITLELNDLSIPVQLGKTAFANVREYFEVRRMAGSKIEKTEQHAQKALKSAEAKINRDLQLNLAKQRQQGAESKLHAIRDPHWFEKFWWFLTSNSYLVVAARDESQKDMLLRRYFFENDIALSSDAPDATLLIVKNYDKSDIPPQTLLQAAAYCVATSVKSWESKSKAPAWYLTRKQVPRVLENGDPISMLDLRYIKPKTIIPPSQTEMGMAILWQTEKIDNDVIPFDSVKADKDENDDDDDEFPETHFDSEDDFPDTNFDSDRGGNSDADSDANEDSSSEAEPDMESSGELISPPKPESSAEVESSVEPESSAESSAAARLSIETHDADSDADADVDANGDADADTEPEEESEARSLRGTPSVGGVPKKIRGGKKKLWKYMAQDEEDRKAAMERLGTLKGLERKAAEKEAQETANRLEKDRREQRKQRARKADLEHIADGPTEATPYPTDLLFKYKESERIIAAVPMFGPWSALQKTQYKAKLVFGPLKKGKASSELIRILLNTGPTPATDQERELFEAIKLTAMQQIIAVSRVQVSAPGLKSNNTKGGSKSGGAKSNGAKGGKKKK